MGAFNLAVLDQKFACLDLLPERLYDATVTHPHGELIPRVQGILRWRSALLAGQLPDHHQLGWPEPGIGLAVLKRLEALDICRYCLEQEELTDRVLLDLLEGIESAEDYFRHKPDGFVDQLAQRQNQRDRDSVFEGPDGLADHLPDETSNQSGESSSSAPPSPTTSGAGGQNVSTATVLPDQTNAPPLTDHVSEPPTNQTNKVTPASANENAETALAIYVANLLSERWQQLLADWQELSVEFSELNSLLGRGWDLSQGTLASENWRQIIHYRKLLKRAPELQRLVALLGRQSPATGQSGDSKAQQDSKAEPLSPPAPIEPPKIPCLKMEAGGIERSDTIDRMLPSELAQLGHPTLKKVWLARRAERLLMTYQYSGKKPKTLPVQQLAIDEASAPTHPKDPGQGPILICLDTSGSMHGQPEHIAKALVLEALRIAFHEQRACHVFNFSGPDEVIEHELDLTQGGLKQLLTFFQQSFHGGTDVTVPLQRALKKQQQTEWRNADILLVSDGRFPLQSEWVTRIKHLKHQQGLRVHGLLLGNWKADALAAICNPCHRFSDWACFETI